MKAFRIDPLNKKITEVEYNGDYKQIYNHINANTFDVATLYDNGDGAYIDDEGLFVENQHFWIHKTFQRLWLVLACFLGLTKKGTAQPQKLLSKN